MQNAIDSLPVVFDKRVQAAKGRPTYLGYELEYREVALSSFVDLARALESLAPHNTAYVIRGAKQVDRPRIRRKVRDIHHLAAAPRRWLCVDLDGKDCPIDIFASPAKAAEYGRTLLPDGLKSALCYYAITGSTHQHKLHIHYWFWLDRHHSDAECKLALSHVADCSLYRPTQPHFTALPLIGADPLRGFRRGVLLGDAAYLGAPTTVDPVAAWAAVARQARDVERAKIGNRHRALNKAGYHMGMHVASGAITRRELEKALMSAAVKADMPIDRARDEMTRAIDDGIRAAGNAPEWLDKLARTEKGAVKPGTANQILALTISPDWCGAIGYDTRNGRMVWLRDPPLQMFRSATTGRPFLDEHAAIAVLWLQEHGMQSSLRGTIDILMSSARRFEFDPVCDMLSELNWDGRPRLSAWLSTYLGSTASPSYLKAVGRAWMISAVARAFQPGCQADYCLVIEGDQGKGKSEATSILGMGYAREIKADLSSKDAIDALHRATWIGVLTELAAAKKTKDLESIKSTLTAREDHYREPYGRVTRTFKRSMVFVATTNDQEYLIDTENRRWWPVLSPQVDIEALARDVEQLWAEAVFAYHNGEQWYLRDEVEAIEEQSKRVAIDPWEALIRQATIGKDVVSVDECLDVYIDISPERRRPYDAQRVAKILRQMGWRKGRRDINGHRQRVFVRPC